MAMISKLWRVAAIALIAGLGPALTSAQPRFDFAATPGRLSKAVVPSAYALSLDVDPARSTFTGTASITLQITAPQPSIVLHAHRLEPLSAELQPEPPGRAIRLAVAQDPKAQQWRLTPHGKAPLAAGNYRLAILYKGRVNESGEGLYRTAEKADRMLATQLQAVEARTLFPGFDEPAYRATFEITVRAPKGLQVLSNMPVAQVTAEGRSLRHRFDATPPMPTYLVALAVGRFDALEGEAAGLPLRILMARGKREQGRFALQATQEVLGYFRDYFGQPYALPKLDQLAVPSVRIGAMEDWGLISYAENALLVDPARTSPINQRRVYGVIAHEVAHQWFGNLVTAASWDEIWLNEAFATWMQHKASARFHPEWQVPLAIRQQLDDVFARDAGAATRAIRSAPVTEMRVFDVFDSITYRKGGAVLSMIESWLGADSFQRGLAAYMADRRFSNATAGDLWHHLSQASGFDVSAVARSWTDQTGYPLVLASSRCTEGRTRLSLRQQRYLNPRGSAEAEATPAASTLWSIPVRVSHAGSEQTLMLDAPEASFDLPGCAALPPIVNAEGLGYYRVQYAPEALQALTDGFAGLSPADQVTLASDTLALAQAARVPLAAWFDLLAVLPATQGAGRAVLMGQSAAALDRLDTALAQTPAQAALRRAGRALLAPELARLGWQPQPGEDDSARLLRGKLIRQLARFDEPEVLQRAGALYDADRAGRQPLEASARDAVIFAAGRGADRARFDRLRADLMASRSKGERAALGAALSAGADAARAEELMGLALEDRLPPDVATRLPGMVAENSAFGAAAYAFSLKHWQRLAAMSGTGPFAARQWLLPAAAEGFADRADAARLRADQQRLAGASGDMPAGEIAEAIELRAALRERESQTLAARLKDWRPR